MRNVQRLGCLITAESQPYNNVINASATVLNSSGTKKYKDEDIFVLTCDFEPKRNAVVEIHFHELNEIVSLEIKELFYVEYKNLYRAIQRTFQSYGTRAKASCKLSIYSTNMQSLSTEALKIKLHKLLLRKKRALSCMKVRVMSEISVIYSPYALSSPFIFTNTVCTGIVSNLIKFPEEDIAVGVLDCSLIENAPGANVIYEHGYDIFSIGICIEKVAPKYLQPFLFLEDVLGKLLRSIGIDSRIVLSNITSLCRSKNIYFSQEKVVLIKRSIGWASGVIVSEKTILTCAHLFQPFRNVKYKERVQVFIFSNGFRRCAEGTLKDICKEGPDLAVIETKDQLLNNFVGRTSFSPKIKVGDKCYAIGFGLLDASLSSLSLNLSFPFVSKGNIGKILCFKHYPCLVQSTASVFSGMSGGGLFDEKGHLIGILTNNVKDREGEIFVNMNFSVVPDIVLQKNIVKNKHLKKEIFDMFSLKVFESSNWSTVDSFGRDMTISKL
eukprot:snap_masked-scaffold_7-processed-gene-11.14-mRNA-1 protein AED:1.00 eAED:1.00 QI:0/0/0/0/1/1/2/0/496